MGSGKGGDMTYIHCHTGKQFYMQNLTRFGFDESLMCSTRMKQPLIDTDMKSEVVEVSRSDHHSVYDADLKEFWI